MTRWDGYDDRRGGYDNYHDPRHSQERQGGAHGVYPSTGGPSGGWNGGGQYTHEAAASYLSYGQPWAPPQDFGPFGNALSFATPGPPFATPFHPTAPAYAPQPFAPAPESGYDRRDNRGPRWERSRPRSQWDADLRRARPDDEDLPTRLSERPPPRHGRPDGRYAAPGRSCSPRRRQGPSRSPSPAPYEAPVAPAYDASGEYIQPARRVRRDARTAPSIPPTDTYLAASLLPSETLATDAPAAPPLVLVMDLNHTLLVRSKRDRMSSRMPVARPYLSTFLSYICARGPAAANPTADTPPPRFDPIVYSSARAPNVIAMLSALSLVPQHRATAFLARDGPGGSGVHRAARVPAYDPRAEEGDVLRMVFTREMMGLSRADYLGDVETVKDLGRVWYLLGFGGDVEDCEMDKTRDETAKVEPRKEELAGSAAAGGCASELGSSTSEAVPAAAGDCASELGSLASEAVPPATAAEAGVPPRRKRLRLNKKAKARVYHARDERGARRTLLLDDEASKVDRSLMLYPVRRMQAQQPYSHLPIAPFLVHPTHFPAAPQSPSRASQALSLDPALPPAQDTALLIAIAQLERAYRETNVAAWVRAGGLQHLRDEARAKLAGAGAGAEVSEEGVDAELARQGEEACARCGVEVRREWDPEWRTKLLAKEGRIPARETLTGNARENAPASV
ncbi:hypothetical protein JCM3770_006096 [Rhodotorula araucariae]